jgi:Na+-translocating ferredoxin:NAD+ oxidoreductase RnfC subunit
LAIREVADFYPSWLPALLVREATGERHVPGAACCPCCDPEDVLILNVETLRDFAAAEDGKPVETRAVSVNGEVMNARIGTPIREFAAQVEFDERPGRHERWRHRVSRTVLIVNGPMRGHVGAPDERVTATTRSVNVLAEDHPAARRMLDPLGTVLARARAACNECGMCTGFCPQAQLGYPISPARIVRAVNYSRGDAADDLLGALHCAGCGLCDLVCPVTLAPSRIVGELKKRFVAAGLEPSRAIALRRSTPSFPCRRMPRERLMARLAVKFECRNPKEIQIEGRSK